MSKKVERRFQKEALALSSRARKVTKHGSLVYVALANMKPSDARIYIEGLVSQPIVKDGFADLWAAGRLDLSLESLIRDDDDFRKLVHPDTLRQAELKLQQANWP